VLQHRPVDLLQQVCPDLDDEVGSYPENMAVVGRVMDLAESQAVTYGGDSRFLTIRDDMGSVKQYTVSQTVQLAPSVQGAYLVVETDVPDYTGGHGGVNRVAEADETNNAKAVASTVTKPRPGKYTSVHACAFISRTIQ